MKSISAFIAIATISLAATANPPAAAGTPPGHPAAAGAPAGHPAAGPADPNKAEIAPTKKAKVVSSIDTKGFTYIEIQDGNKKLWLVAPSVAVKSGNTISYVDAPVQAKYHSPSLNRDFTNIILTTRAVVDK